MRRAYAAFFSGDSEMFVHSLWAFSQSNLANWMTEDTRVVWVWNWWRAAYIGVEIAAGVLIAAGFVMYVYAELISPYVAESKRRKALKESK